MNLEEFLVELGKTKTKQNWMQGLWLIRAKTGNTYFCPITAVILNKTGKTVDTTQAFQAGEKELGLTSENVTKILASSDLWIWLDEFDLSFRENMQNVLDITY